jgi:hypothetical protein
MEEHDINGVLAIPEFSLSRSGEAWVRRWFGRCGCRCYKESPASRQTPLPHQTSSAEASLTSSNSIFNYVYHSASTGITSIWTSAVANNMPRDLQDVRIMTNEVDCMAEAIVYNTKFR